MKNRGFTVSLIALILVAGALAAQAEVDVRLGFRGGGGYYGHRYWGRPYGYRGPAVVVAPGYYADPYYYPPPVYAAPVYAPSPYTPQQSPTTDQTGTAVPLSGDYGTDLATLHGKLSKLRTLLSRQKSLGGLTEAQYNGFLSQLDAIEKEEHTRSFNNNGRLTDDDFAELIGRTNEVGEAIKDALAQ